MMFEQKVVLITGAGRGIGRGCALSFARAGADVALISRTGRELDDAAAEIEALGRRAWPLECDVTDTATVTAAVGRLDRVDVLVHAAGANIPEPFVDIDETHLDYLLALNLKSAFVVGQAVARKMLERDEGGAIIFLSSQLGHVGLAGRTVYCATKHGIEGLTKTLALELAPRRIRVVSVAPTFIETPMTERVLSDSDFRNMVLSKIPMGRIGDVSEVTEAIVFLASPGASLITGTSLVIDGGWTAQ